MTLITKKRPLRPYLALYVQSSQRVLFTKATPTNYRICHNFNCHINERETPKTCLTNHKGSTSHHIMPLVINSLGGRHTCTHAYRHRGQKQFQETSHVPAKSRHAPGLKIEKFWQILTKFANHCFSLPKFWNLPKFSLIHRTVLLKIYPTNVLCHMVNNRIKHLLFVYIL